MFLNCNIEEYPYVGTFYRTEIDESVPLGERIEQEVVIATVKCDIQEDNKRQQENTLQRGYVIYVQNESNSDILVESGVLFKARQNGLLVKGTVDAVFPSQLDGYTVYVKSNEV